MRTFPLLALTTSFVAACAAPDAAPDAGVVAVTLTMTDGRVIERAGSDADLVEPVIAGLAGVPLIVDGKLSADPGDVLVAPESEAVLVPGNGVVRFVADGPTLEVHLGDLGASLFVTSDLAAGHVVVEGGGGALEIVVEGIEDPARRRSFLGAIVLALATAHPVPQLPELSQPHGFWQCVRKLFKIGGPIGIAIDVAFSYHTYTSSVECRERGSAWCYRSCADGAAKRGQKLHSAKATCDGATATCKCEYERNDPSPSATADDELETCSMTTSDPFPCPEGYEDGSMCVEESTCCASPEPSPEPSPSPSPSPEPSPSPSPEPSPSPSPEPSPSPSPSPSPEPSPSPSPEPSPSPAAA